MIFILYYILIKYNIFHIIQYYKWQSIDTRPTGWAI